MTPQALVEACDSRLRALETAANRAWWDANVEASEETARRRAEADVALSDVLADRDTFAAIRAARTENGLDAVTARALDMLERAYTPHQVDPDLRRRIIDGEHG